MKVWKRSCSVLRKEGHWKVRCHKCGSAESAFAVWKLMNDSSRKQCQYLHYRQLLSKDYRKGAFLASAFLKLASILVKLEENIVLRSSRFSVEEYSNRAINNFVCSSDDMPHKKVLNILSRVDRQLLMPSSRGDKKLWAHRCENFLRKVFQMSCETITTTTRVSANRNATQKHHFFVLRSFRSTFFVPQTVISSKAIRISKR